MGIPALFFINTHPIATKTVSSVHKIHLVRAHRAPEDFVNDLFRLAKERGIELSAEMGDEAVTHYKYDSPQAAKLKYMLNFSLAPQARDAIIEQMFDEIFSEGEAAWSERLYMSPEQIAELAKHGCIG